MAYYLYSNPTSPQLWFLCEGYVRMLYALHVQGYLSQAQYHACSSETIRLAVRAGRA